MTYETFNPWTAADDGEHFPCVMEWWCAEAFFQSEKDKRSFSLKSALVEWFESKKKIGSNVNITLFDQQHNNHYVFYSRDDTKKLCSQKNTFHVAYEESWLTGKYPHYQMHFVDPKHNITLDLQYQAESVPHWVAQDVTGGWLPLGLGFYRYGFIPKCRLTGTITIEDEIHPVRGVGYYEHVWGDFSYSSPLKNLLNLSKTIGTYSRLILWWLSNHHRRIPRSLKFSTENNPLGYDWVWAVFDNGWTLFYGNIMFWIMQGPTAGSLIFSKDGKQYTEFCDVHFRYNKIRYAREFDFYYPSELEIVALKGTEKLSLIFKMTADTAREYISPFKGNKFWHGLAICESPGEVSGCYSNGDKTVPLHGFCKIEPQRQISRLGHNSLQINILKPPQGLGVSGTFHSHLIKKEIHARLCFSPFPHVNASVKRLDASKIHSNKVPS